MQMSSKINISLIIPTYNREKVLCDTVKYALGQNRTDYEIIIVDQTRSHFRATTEFLENLPEQVRIIHHRPPSLPAARNRGITEANGQIVIMIDDDVIIKPDFILQHESCYQSPLIGGVTGKITQANRYRTKIPFFLKKDALLQWISSENFAVNDEIEAFRLAGGNFSVRRESALAAGLFDEDFIGSAWGEEFDFSLRLKKIGYKILYNPVAEIVHLNESFGGCESRKRYDFFTVYSKAHNLAYFIEKNRLGRYLYFYLIWYIYKQVLVKKDYLNIKGLLFIFKGNLSFLKGFTHGYKKGRSASLKTRCPLM